jgi:lactate permease
MGLLVFILPFVVLLLLTLVFRASLWKSAIAGYITNLVLVFFTRGFDTELFKVPLTNSLLLSLELATILFGAIFFLNILKNNGTIDKISATLNNITPEKSIQVILLAWLFGSFIEGISGFGTPAVIVAPLLASLGFPLVLAVLLPLMANTTAVTFGAVGTPIKIGFANIPAEHVAQTAAGINLLAALLVPVFLIYYTNKFTETPKKFKSLLPFALLAGLSFLVPYFLFSFIGPEFPSIIGGFTGLVICFFLIKKKVFLSSFPSSPQLPSMADIFGAFWPYLLISALLLAGKFALVDYHFKVKVAETVYRKVAFFQPGMAFLTAIVIMAIIAAGTRKYLKASAIKAVKAMPAPLAAIFFIIALTQNLLLVGKDESLASLMAPYFSVYSLPFLASFLGTFGSFAAGSATVSNLLFGHDLYELALLAKANVPIILALQLTGAAIGNAIALQNIAVVQAAVGLQGQEKNLLRSLIAPCLIYLTVAALIGFVCQILL